jgi:hypothetical protein
MKPNVLFYSEEPAGLEPDSWQVMADKWTDSIRGTVKLLTPGVGVHRAGLNRFPIKIGEAKSLSEASRRTVPRHVWHSDIPESQLGVQFPDIYFLEYSFRTAHGLGPRTHTYDRTGNPERARRAINPEFHRRWKVERQRAAAAAAPLSEATPSSPSP